mgnify:CR=1 FL=1
MNKKQDNVITIGLFGTCGDSQWRARFMEKYNERGIAYFNPVVPDWKPENAEIEAEHLILDEIVLFPVTNETLATGSLAEVGFSILQAITSNDERFVIIYIDPKVSQELWESNPAGAKDSERTRALIKAHLKKQTHKYPNAYVVNSLDDMLNASFLLYDAMSNIKKVCSISNR